MNRITLSNAIEGYLLDAEARRLSPNTIKLYTFVFRRLNDFFENDPPFATIEPADGREFLSKFNQLANSSLLQYHAAMSALWRWAHAEGLTESSIMQNIAPPKPEEHVIEPFTEDQVKAMLAALGKSQPYTRPGKTECSNSLRTSLRNKAIILLLLDTGIRATELCTLPIPNCDSKQRQILVKGKGSKERIVPIAAQVVSAIHRYQSRERPETNAQMLFVTPRGGPLDRYDLNHIIVRIAERAGVANAYPHRFRHTFAITYLRNGGDIFTLQKIMGHSSLEMCRRYLAIAKSDIEAAHKMASPVANWRL